MEASTNNTNQPTSFQSSSTQTDSKLHFLDYWRIIRIRKTVILAVFLLVVITTTAVTFMLPQSYMASARIEVSKDVSDINPLMPTMQSVAYDPYFLQTEFEKIRSQKVLHQVIGKMKLNDVWTKRFQSEVKLKTNETFAILKRQVDVAQARNTSLIEVRCFSDDPTEAAEIANTIVEVYGNLRKESRLAQSASGIQALQEELDKHTKIVKDAEAEVDALREKLGISDIGNSEFQMVLEPETVRQLERDRILADGEYVKINRLHESLSKKSRQELREAIPTTYPDEQLREYLSNFGKTEQNLALISKDFAPEHPEVVRLTALLSTINNQIESRINGVMEGLKITVQARKDVVDTITKRLDDAKKRDASQMALYRPYFAARRDLETKQKIRDSVHIRILQEKVDEKIPKSGMVEILDRAEKPTKAVRPNIPLNITLGVIVGLVMGFGLAFFIEYLDTSVKTIDDVERSLQAPVLGVIPQNVGSLLDEGPDSPHAEAYRVLRTNLLFGRKDQSMNTLTVVSGGAGEGKSTTIFNLATIFAQNGAKVLLVDSDLRRPSLHKLLNVSNSIGLTNLLLKQNTIEEVIQTTKVPGLHFMPSGKLPSSSLGVLNSTHMREFVRQARERYDFVMFDSPPIMGVSDASILASVVDMALLVIQYRKYPQVMTMRAKQMVEKVGGQLMGVVLNNINISQDSYYYYYSGYYYDYYSKHDDQEGKSGNGEPKNGEGRKAGDRGGIELKQKF